jgi:DNA-binding NarL/FixJ family response regulator
MKDPTDKDSIRLVLLDDQVLLRAGIARLLAAEPGFEVVGEYGSPIEAMEVLRSSTADLILLDFDLGVNEDEGFMAAARAAGYRGRFLIVAGTSDVMEDSARALKLGASGIFLKSEPPERLVRAIRYVAGGALWLDQRVLQRLADRFISDQPPTSSERRYRDLSDRERRVLQGVIGGLTNKKIAGSMALSEGSVKNLLQGLFAKAGVRTRSQLVRVTLQGSLWKPRQLAEPEASAASPTGNQPDSHLITA